MATNLAIDDTLIIQAQKIAGLKTKKDTVTLALKEFISRRKQEEIIDLFKSLGFNSQVQPFLVKEGLTANRFSLLLKVTTLNKRGEYGLSAVNPRRENYDIRLL